MKETPTRAIQLHVRVSEEELQAINAAADSVNLTTAEYVRRAALHRRIVPPTPRPDFVGAAILGQHAGLLKQIYKQGLADEDQTWEVLTLVKGAIRKLRTR